MRFGITGNTNKDSLWEPVSGFISRLNDDALEYVLHPAVAGGLAARGVQLDEGSIASDADGFLEAADLILSFGGDGTLLNTAHLVGRREIPVLGVNFGRLGFLAHTESAGVARAIERILSGDYVVNERLALTAARRNDRKLPEPWALNEFTIQRTGETGLLAIEVHVDDRLLNKYWADGLIISTPTGSTAYSLAVGGPIMAPGCGGILINPIASHTLTVRPIVIPEDSVIDVRVVDPGKPYVVTADGVAQVFEEESPTIRIQRADHVVRLVTFPDQDYYSTLRNKLMWGARKGASEPGSSE
ncbi:MAG: ATP-NAD kinase [Rhodothermales bacterium]|nr:ATP-NAD kinase [Rhodothermales bacterium]